MNLTNAIYFLTSLNPTYMRSVMETVTSFGANVSPECWLKFPFVCLGCQFDLMKAELKHTEYYHNFQILADVCSIIQGHEKGEVVKIDDEEFVKNLRHAVQYAPFLRPSFPYTADVINVGFQLVHIENPDLSRSSFKIDLILEQEWTDKRLQHNYPGVLDATHLELSVWRPDSYFVQSKKGKYNNYTVQQGTFMKIRQNGHVRYGSKMAIEVSCPMDLREFPMDIQTCALELESYGFRHDEVRYNWSIVTISLNSLKGSLKALSQYDLRPVVTSQGISQYVLGNWSKLRMEFVFVRNSIIFIPAMYFPCAMIVFISWITFMLDVDHYPARTYLCVTSLLTIVTMQAAINSSLPWVSYLKAIDKYVMICVLFVAGAFLEYACVLYIRSKKHWKKNSKQISAPPENKEEPLLLSDHCQEDDDSENKIRRRRATRRNPIWRQQVGMYKKLHKSDHITFTKYEKIIRFYLNDGWPKKLDIFSRVFFPMSFVAFNLFYWISSGDVK